MSFGASSHSFPLESVYGSLELFVRSDPVRVNFYDVCKETRVVSRLVILSIDSIDDAKASTGYELNRGPNCSMNVVRAQDQ